MKFAASVKKVIAFLLCLALLTSDVTVTNATSVDTTDVFAEIPTEMLNETKMQGRKVPGRKEMCQIQMEQEIQKKSGIQRTARARK